MAYNRDRAPKEDNGPEMIEKVVYLNRVSKTVKGGRVMKFSALVVVGDGKGTVGYGQVPALQQPAERCQGNDAGSGLSARRSGSCSHQRQERRRDRRLRRAQNGES